MRSRRAGLPLHRTAIAYVVGFVHVLVAVDILVAVTVEARALLHCLQLEVSLYAQGLPAPARIIFVEASCSTAWRAVDEVVVTSLGAEVAVLGEGGVEDAALLCILLCTYLQARG